MRAAVVAAGDLGLSPRIQYHALALARSGAQVHLIGFAGTPCLDEVESHPGIRIHALPATPFENRDPARRADFVLRSGARLLHQAAWLGATLLRVSRGADLVLVQNPPALPTLPLAQLAARASGARFVVDWHNLSAAVLQAKLGRESAVVRTLGLLERQAARAADANLCVSQALADRLRQELGAPAAVVLPDLPHGRFCMAPRPEDPAHRRRVRGDLGLPATGAPLLVCPTSWSHDEDISVLLHALDLWDTGWDTGGDPRPALEVVITGRGPGRETFESELSSRSWKRSRVSTRWFSHGDYARLLACADLGLCLHRSTSGVDLPMKLADFAAAGLPACALDYGPVLGEAPAPGAMLRFGSAAELAGCWNEAFGLEGGLDAVRRAAAVPVEGWEDAWQRVAAPHLGLEEGVS
jgi:beta-1,4-mannosyltransferase